MIAAWLCGAFFGALFCWERWAHAQRERRRAEFLESLPPSDDDWLETDHLLLEAARLIEDDVLSLVDLQAESERWDILSDEALANFERQLGDEAPVNFESLPDILPSAGIVPGVLDSSSTDTVRQGPLPPITYTKQCGVPRTCPLHPLYGRTTVGG